MKETRILVVEDERIIAEDIRMSLQNLGYAVPSIASSGEEAIEEVGRTGPNLVLMDIVLSGEMDGIDAANHIRSNFNIPVVFLTAYSDEKTLERAKITEPFGYIVKPFIERELHINIEIALYKHKIEKKLKESKEWFSKTLKSIGDAVIAVDARDNVIFMNPAAELLTGWNMEQALGKPLKEVFTIITEETGGENPVSMVVGEGVVVDQANQIMLVARDGTVMPIEDSGDPIRDDQGNIIGSILVFRDATERREAEEEMMLMNEFYKSVLDSIIDGIYVTDRDDVICYANKGISHHENVLLPSGVRVLLDLPERTLEVFKPQYIKAKETLQPVHFKKVPFVTSDGSQRYKSGWLVPRIKDGNYNGMVMYG